MDKLGNDVESQGPGMVFPAPVSKLRRLPAHLPRNLASFSPSVDDRDSGGPRPGGLGHNGRLISRRGGSLRVLTVHFNSRGQRGDGGAVLQGERGAVHRLALGRSSALRAGHRVGAVQAAAEAGAQLQAPHVADHSRGVKGLPPFAFGKVFPHLPAD